MKIVVAMDSFKGLLTAERACTIVAESIASVVPRAEIVVKPMADGGEGTAQTMIAAGNGQWVAKTVTGPAAGGRKSSKQKIQVSRKFF